MIAYQDPQHPSYHGKKTGKCFGCGTKCCKSAWGWWCHPCNVKRLDQISATLDGMVERARFSAAVQAAVKERVEHRRRRPMDGLIERLNATGKWWIIGKGKVTAKEPLYACLIQEACIDGRAIARVEGDDLSDCVERALAKAQATSPQ